MYSLIAATNNLNGLGANNQIPWHNSADMAFFRTITNNKVVIMGHNTFKSIGKGLKNRINVIISRSEVKSNDKSIHVFNSPNDAIYWLDDNYPNIHKFVIGGSQIYNWFLENRYIYDIYHTRIDNNNVCDVFFNLPKNTKLIKSEPLDDLAIMFYYIIVNNEAVQIQNLIRQNLNSTESKDRTSIGTYSQIGTHVKFDLSNNSLPLITTRKGFLRGIFEELMLCLRGQTDSTILEKKNINIWKPNTSREKLDLLGLQHMPVGDMGASYGFQMRHFGASYITCKTDYENKGFDQLNYVINELKNNPSSRRAVITLWNPADLNKMALPPCLYGYQFSIKNNKLHCIMTQRSNDICVAGSWNVTNGALFTIMMAHVLHVLPGSLTWNVADSHVYKNHVATALEELKRTPTIYPKLFLKSPPEDITQFNYYNIKLTNYKSAGRLSYIMNA